MTNSKNTLPYRHAEIDPETFLNAFKEARDKNQRYFYIDNYRFKTQSHRYHLFTDKGTQCASCGLQANTFIVESRSEDERPHANLYHITHDKDGNEMATLFTKDHILPRSLGGKDEQNNYQTMCEPCNKTKGNKMTETDVAYVTSSLSD